MKLLFAAGETIDGTTVDVLRDWRDHDEEDVPDFILDLKSALI